MPRSFLESFEEIYRVMWPLSEAEKIRQRIADRLGCELSEVDQRVLELIERDYTPSEEN